ncbi:MAG: LysM peptidoglycan-binding domain-containing protein [Lentisphaeria bacterium]|nr:LysM peptidoglycan-binding domain-containing protein [Lentisphaeria bacterium]
MSRFWVLLTIILICGCSRQDERNHPLYQKALKAQSAGNGSDAAMIFNELLKRRPRSVLAHLKLAAVYDELLNDPAMAVVHYRAYLDAAPDAPDAEEVRAWMLRAEKRHYEILKKRYETTDGKTVVPEPENTAAAAEEKTAEESTGTGQVPETEKNAVAEAATPTENPAEAPAVETKNIAEKTPESVPEEKSSADKEKIAGLEKRLEQYQARHRMMIAELERLRSMARNKTAASADASAPVTTAAVPADADNISGEQALNYTVKSGDTPGSIARKMYGRSSLYRIILRANPQIDERRLRPGTVLKIPRINTEKKGALQ